MKQIRHLCIDCNFYMAMPGIPFCGECEYEREECADLITRMIQRYERDFHVPFDRTDSECEECEEVEDKNILDWWFIVRDEELIVES